MARGGGLDVRPVFGHPLFLITLIVAVAGWWTAFIGQIVFEAKYHAQANAVGSAVGVGWFSIFLQLAMIVFVFYTLATDTIGTHRFQLSVFLAINVVFAVLGVNSGIFLSTSFQRAIGVGWLLLTIVDIIWLLYFTSEEDSLLLHLFNSSSSNTFSRNTTSRRSTIGAGRQQGNMSSAQSQQQATYNSAVSYPKAAGAGAGGSLINGGMSHADLSNGGGAMQNGVGGGEEGMTGQAMSENGAGSAGGAQEYTLRARALYAYNASPDDPNEISFGKGEMLDIVDNTGKWWQARKADGTKGIIPSNYVVLS